MDVSNFVQTVAIYALPVLFAITLHEAAHGYVARHFGDMTAYAQGRISLNPARHIDVQGTIIAPLVILVLTAGNFAFGWAKPVPVNYSALKNPKRDMALVAAAGPLSNLAMAIGWTFLLRVVMAMPENYFSASLVQMAIAGVVVNIGLLVINLLPILPLDGGRVLAGLLPGRLSREFGKTERWGGLLFMVILIMSIADSWMNDGKYVREFFAPLNKFILSVARAVLNF
jgi:Zn-dependent protease